MATGKKRGLVYGVIGVMLCAAIYLNWSYVQSPEELLVAGQADAELSGASVMQSGSEEETAAEEQATVTSGSDYFAQSRLAREQARDEAISILQTSLQDEKADEKTKEDAAGQISQRFGDRSKGRKPHQGQRLRGRGGFRQCGGSECDYPAARGRIPGRRRSRGA